MDTSTQDGDGTWGEQNLLILAREGGLTVVVMDGGCAGGYGRPFRTSSSHHMGEESDGRRRRQEQHTKQYSGASNCPEGRHGSSSSSGSGTHESVAPSGNNPDSK